VRHLWGAIRDPRVLILGVIQFGFLVGSYGVGIWLPQIMKVGRLSSLQIGFLTSGVYAFASAGMIGWASYVDRRGRTVRTLAVTCAIGGIGLILAVVTRNFWLSMMWITVSLIGINGARGIFFTVPMRFLTDIALAGGLAFINSIGTAGGFIGPFVMGWLTDRTGSFSAGLGAMSGFLLLAAVMASALTVFITRE
jgi:MFS family permease